MKITFIVKVILVVKQLLYKPNFQTYHYLPSNVSLDWMYQITMTSTISKCKQLVNKWLFKRGLIIIVIKFQRYITQQNNYTILKLFEEDTFF